MARGSRRRSRIRAFQVLFEADLAGRPPREVLDRQLAAEPLDEDARAFVERLVGGVDRHRTTLDAEIARLAPAFPLADMGAVDRNVLRLALFELRHDDTPLRVVIDEAVELAKGYGTESSGRFVHGVLGAAVAAGEADPPPTAPDTSPRGDAAPDAAADTSAATDPETGRAAGGAPTAEADDTQAGG